MKRLLFLIVVLFTLSLVTACDSLDGTTLADQQTVKDGQPVDMHGK